jgi:osmotically-inducible protein OsmY
LSGTVANFEQIARAILIASETPGVRKTLSTIQVKK